MKGLDEIRQKSIVFLLVLFLSFYIVFQGKVYGFEWILAALIILMLIINGLNSYWSKWEVIKESAFVNKLFWNSFIIRVVSMFILLIISYKTWDMFYVVGAKDEQVYYRVAAEAVDIWKTFSISEAYSHIFTSYKGDISDTGFSTFLMFPIRLFGLTPVVIKLFFCFLGSLVVVRGYKLAALLMEAPAARLAGIFLMFYPISWFYSSIMLKESLMVALMIEASIAIVKAQRSFKLSYSIKALVFIILLFFFRSAISILFLMVLGLTLLFQKRIRSFFFKIIVASVIIIVYIYFLKTTGRFDEYYNQYTNIDEFTQERLTFIESINPLVALAGSPVFAVLSYISPFPSVVTVPNAGGLPHTEYYYHIAGNIFWIIFAFFSFYGLYFALRFRRQEMAVLIAFIIGYQFVLLKAMMFTSVRFSYPAKPFLFILAAFGIYQIKNKKWFPVYLAVALILILGWNYVRLKGRG